MKSKLLFLLFAGFLFSCTPSGKKEDDNATDKEPTTQATTNPELDQPKPEEVPERVNFNDTIETPSGLTELSRADGDLDKDKTDERVIVYDNGTEGDMGTEREIHIFRKGKQNWELSEKIVGGILPSEHGGLLGDPFAEINIERGCMVINHFGGSRWKWEYTHRFRQQNGNWELIGATSGSYANCEYSETWDYNVSNGNIEYKKEILECEEVEMPEGNENKPAAWKHSHQLDPKPVLAGFYPGNNELKIDENKNFYY